ncbi:MAG: crotonase/enoyl-CoA hydratase family protein [Rhodospirillales bacterium]
MTDDPVIFDQRHGMAILTLNRPDQLNALNFALIGRFMAHLDTIERDDAIRAVIVTGAGDRAFSAGADIKEFAHSVAAGVAVALRDFVARGQAFTSRIERFPKPIIGAVNGLAFGGGCEMLEAMPLAVAADTATFAKPEINLGFPPPFGGTQRLPRLIGRKRALEMILTGDPITAEEARRAGLINRVVSKSKLISEAEKLAQRIIEKTPVSVAASLAAVTRGINLSIDEGLAMEAAQFARAAATPAVTDGIARFLARSAGGRGDG